MEQDKTFDLMVRRYDRTADTVIGVLSAHVDGLIELCVEDHLAVHSPGSMQNRATWERE